VATVFGPSLLGCVKYIYSLRSVERYVLKEFHTFLLSSNPSLARCLQVSLYLSSLCVAGIQIKTPYALQRQNTEISKQIFPEKEYRGVSPNFQIHASVSDLHISTIGLPIVLEEICRPILGLYKSLTDT
jgi:hypothetical protein